MSIMDKFLRMVLDDFPKDLKNFLKTPWLDGSGCHIAFANSGGKPVLFFILCGSGSGQQTLDPVIETNRSKVIQKLAKDAGVTTVFLEGSPVGQEMKKSLFYGAGDLGEEALGMKAEEHAQSKSPAPITLVGIDDEVLYFESANALREWQKEENVTKSALAALEKLLRAKREECSSELRKILEAKESYKNGSMPLKNYVQFLYVEAEGASVSLKEKNSFAKLWKVMSEESDIDFDAAERERTLLMEELGPALSDPKQWIGRSLQALAPDIIKETISTGEIETQAKLLDTYLRASPEKMREFRESQFFRTAMYGAYRQGMDGLEKSGATPEEYNKAFVIGMLYGPKAIGELVEKKFKEHLEGRLSIADIYHFTLDLAKFVKFEENRIPNIIRYARYVRRYEAVLIFNLFEEIAEIEKKIARNATFSEMDKEVMDICVLLEEMTDRVLLRLSPGEKAKDFSQEEPRFNRSRAIRESPVLQGAQGEVIDSLDLLDKVESITRRFYAGSVPRGKKMVETVMREMGKRHIDRAIVSVGGFHCKSMINEIAKNEKLERIYKSYIVILPTPGRDSAVNDLSAGNAFAGKKTGLFYEELVDLFAEKPEDYPSLGDSHYKKFDDLPIKYCSNEMCRYKHNHCIFDRVVCLRPPGSRATFYCATCRTSYCGLELQQVPALLENVRALSEDSPLRTMMKAIGAKPFGLRCRHCGNFVGQGNKTNIWIEKSILCTTGLFDLLFGEYDTETISEAGRTAKEGLDRDRIEAAQKEVIQAEEQFWKNSSSDFAYELGECYQQLIEIFAGREHLSERKEVKRKLLNLLKWMKDTGIELGDAEAVLKLLEIEFYYIDIERRF
jgi:hypothetical protein